jgi:asparagine synthetase B (glutamine-hydrolysing)
MRPFVAHLRADAALAEFDEQLGLAFDGRLDNRRELSAMLGEQFASDASLALACWRRFGKAAPERWQGPFAVAVLERASGRAWLARDEVGVRGLAYGRDLDGNWVAATFEHEVARAIAAGLDEVRIAAFLALREPEPWRSFFVGVSQALPGELTELRADGTVVRTPLARPHQAPAPVEGDLEIAAVEFTQHVDSAVRHTLDDCDPPFALLFSGGLDSTTLACSMVAQGRPPAALISWNFDSFPDERAYQQALAQQLGLPLHPLLLDHAIPLGEPGDWPVHPSTPEQTPFRLLHEAACRKAAQLGVRTLLWGYGGDMFFAGAEALPRGLLRRGKVFGSFRALANSVQDRELRPTLRDSAPPHWLRRWQRRRSPLWLTEEGARQVRAIEDFWTLEEARADFPRRYRGLTSFASVQGDANENWFSAPYGLGFEAPLRDRALVAWILGAAPWNCLEPTRELQRRGLSGRCASTLAKRPGKGSLEPLLRRLLTDPDARRKAADWLFSDRAQWPRFVRRSAIDAVWGARDTTNLGLRLFWSALSLELWLSRRAER